MSNKFLKFSASGLEKSKKDRIMKCLIKKATKRYVCAKNQKEENRKRERKGN